MSWDPDNEHPAYRAVTAMTVIMSDEAASIAGLSRSVFSKVSRLGPMIHELRERLHAVREPGYRGDQRVVDSWAEYFGLRGRYEWKSLNEVR